MPEVYGISIPCCRAKLTPCVRTRQCEMARGVPASVVARYIVRTAGGERILQLGLVDACASLTGRRAVRVAAIPVRATAENGSPTHGGEGPKAGSEEGGKEGKEGRNEQRKYPADQARNTSGRPSAAGNTRHWGEHLPNLPGNRQGRWQTLHRLRWYRCRHRRHRRRLNRGG